MFTDRRRTMAARTPRAEEALQGAGTSRTPEEGRPDSETVPRRFAEEPPWAGPFPVQLHAAHIPRSLGIETAQSATLGRHFGLWTRMSFEAQTHFLTSYSAGTTAHKLFPTLHGDPAPRPVAGSWQPRAGLPVSRHCYNKASCTPWAAICACVMSIFRQFCSPAMLVDKTFCLNQISCLMEHYCIFT